MEAILDYPDQLNKAESFHRGKKTVPMECESKESDQLLTHEANII